MCIRDRDRHPDRLPGGPAQPAVEPGHPVLPTGAVMSRRPEDVRVAMATAAGLVAFDADHTWRDVLFAGTATTDLSRPGDPDRSLVPGGNPAGQPGRVAEAAPFPLTPTAGSSAPHRLRLHSPVLGFDGGTMTVRITLVGAGTAAGLMHALWRYPRLDGTEGIAGTGTISGDQVTVVLVAGCGVESGDRAVTCSLAWVKPRAVGRTRSGGMLASSHGSPLVPQAAYLNDGALDVTKEFQPFGAAAKRGDAMYLRSDEAFSKPLSSLTVGIQVMQEGGSALSSAAGGSGIPNYLANDISYTMNYLQSSWGSAMSSEVQDAFDHITGLVSFSTTPHVEWQRRVDGEWQTFKDVGSQLTGFTGAPVSGAVCSEPAVIGGQQGHLVRAFLAEGDFGWTDYQQEVAAFATGAVAGDTPTMPTPPVPPIVSRVTLSYTTAPVAASRVEALNGWATTTQAGSGTFHPFTRTVSPSGDTGMVAIGLDLPATAIGSTVSVYLQVESASPCGSSADPEGAHWECWDGAAWQALPVADGSRLLRESGLLRFVAPTGWAVGCSAVTTDTGRWVRLVTDTPERLGVITSVTPDAVVATYLSQALDPASDPSPATALAPGTIKGALSPVPGVKKVTNLAGVPGRGPEDDAAYRRRASAIARHRGRAVTGWDYEEVVTVEFPEVAAVRCLPHTGQGGVRMAGGVGLVVLPDRPFDPAPRPSVSLAGRITDVLAPMAGLHAEPTVLCPLYAAVTVEADVLLRRGIAALTGRGAATPTRWGRSLFRSSLEAFLDGLPEVDTVQTVTAPPGGPTTTRSSRA